MISRDGVDSATRTFCVKAGAFTPNPALSPLRGKGSNVREEAPMTSKVYTLAGGEIVLWAEEGRSIMVKTAATQSDPVELGEAEADELIEVLKVLLSQIT
jgi:hypothetical protein